MSCCSNNFGMNNFGMNNFGSGSIATENLESEFNPEQNNFNDCMNICSNNSYVNECWNLCFFGRNMYRMGDFVDPNQYGY